MEMSGRVSFHAEPDARCVSPLILSQDTGPPSVTQAQPDASAVAVPTHLSSPSPTVDCIMASQYSIV